MNQSRLRTGTDANDPRRAALNLLHAVLEQGRPLDDAFPRAIQDVKAPRDRAFARLLAASTLRRLGEIDAVLSTLLDKPLPSRLAAVKHVLRLGACQLLVLGTPPHAAVAASVDLVQTVGQGRFKGLVNAVLRRLAREGGLRDDLDALRLNTPDWLWDSWRSAYGEDTARAIAAAHLAEAPLDLTLKPGLDKAAWAERLEARVLPTGSLRRATGGDVAALPGFGEGAWWVQDTAAALPARLLGDVKGRRIADLCAAPGGKTLQLAAEGAEVFAVDISRKRLARLDENLERLGLSAQCIAADAALWGPPEPLDAVLLDAPCSATGTIRRHPDVARLKTQEAVTALTEVQDRLLAASARMVKPGGLVIYCVCSLQPEEGRARIEKALENLPFEPFPLKPEEDPTLAPFLTPAGELRTLPCHLAREGGMDGFYAARLRRVAGNDRKPNKTSHDRRGRI